METILCQQAIDNTLKSAHEKGTPEQCPFFNPSLPEALRYHYPSGQHLAVGLQPEEVDALGQGANIYLPEKAATCVRVPVTVQYLPRSIADCNKYRPYRLPALKGYIEPPTGSRVDEQTKGADVGKAADTRGCRVKAGIQYTLKSLALEARPCAYEAPKISGVKNPVIGLQAA